MSVPLLLLVVTVVVQANPDCLGDTLKAEDYNSKCWGGGCCNDAVASHPIGFWLNDAKARKGAPSALIKNVSLAQPFGAAMGVTDLRPQPMSADRIMGVLQPPGTLMKVYVKLKVMSIWSVNQKSQSYMMKYQLSWYWRDCRLLYGCKTVLQVPDTSEYFEHFWRPRVAISEQEDLESSMTSRIHYISGVGDDVYDETYVGKFRCKMNFEDLPLDEQKCLLTITVPQEGPQIQLVWADIEHAAVLVLAEWKISEADSWSKETVPLSLNYESFQKRTFDYTGLRTSFTFKRKPSYSYKQYVIPITMFYMLTYAGSYIDGNAVPARVAAHVIPMLITSNKQSALAASLPPFDYFSKLDLWMMMNLVLLTLHLVDYVIARQLERIGKSLVALDQKRKEDPEATAQVSGWEKFARKVVPTLNLHGHLFLKIISPLVYIVASIVIFQK